MLPKLEIKQYQMGKKQWELFVEHYRPVLLPIWPTVSHGYRWMHFEEFDVYVGSMGITIYTAVDLDWILEKYPHRYG